MIGATAPAGPGLRRRVRQAAAEAAAAPRRRRRPAGGLGRSPAPAPASCPFYLGFFGALGALLAVFLGQQVLMVSSMIVLIVVALFLAVGLNPLGGVLHPPRPAAALGGPGRHRRRLVALALFVIAIVPVISDQVAKIVDKAPGWLDSALHNRQVQRLDDRTTSSQGQGVRRQGRLRLSRVRRRRWASGSPCCRPWSTRS